MRNKYAVLPLLGLLLLSAVVRGQSTAQSTMKDRLIRRVLEEKLRLPNGIEREDDDRAARTTTGADGRVSAAASSSIDEAEISMAYKPTDSSKLVISYMKQSSGALSFPVYYSSNGGSTWTASTFNSTAILNADFPGQFAAGGGDPVFAWDKNGRVYLGWIYLSAKPSFDTAFFTLNWAYSDDDGHTWNIKPNHFIGQGAIDIAGGGTYFYKDGITDREWFAIDNSGGANQGNLYCSYVCFPPGSAPGFQAVKTLKPGIDTFGPAVPAFIGDCQFGNVEVDKAGILHMSLADIGNSEIRHVRSIDGGTSFLPSVVVAHASTMFPDTPFVVHNRENAAVNMAVDGASGSGNNVHIVWSDFPGGGVVKSYYAHSSDGGNSWNTPDTLNKYFGTNVTLMPTVGAEGSNVSVSLTVVDSVDSARYYQLNSADNGGSFTMQSLLSSVPTNYHAIGAADPNSGLFFGDYNRSQRTSCVAYAAWEDGRNLGSKVYFSKTNYCLVGVREVTAVNDDVQLQSLYPNPASDRITLKISAAAATNVTITLTDMSGRQMLRSQKALKNGTQQIDVPLNGLASGVYLVAIHDNTGLVATRSVVVR